VLVERVEGFASPEEWGRAYEEIVSFEQGLADEGTIVAKLWLHTSPEEQLKRFEARADDPLKAWKLTPEDWENRAKRSEYEEAVEEMLDRTDRRRARWRLISAESKRYARVQVLRVVNEEIEAGMRRWGQEPPPPP
jgi:polyphosphate kinase 2 (PPK2 family)